MSRYEVTSATYGDVEAIVLRDDETGSEVRVAPAIGCNVFRFATCVDGLTLDFVQAPAEAKVLREAPTGHGIPVMVPYPGRVRDGQFQFEGRSIALPLADGRGHAIHGCVRQRAWKVVGTAATAAAEVTCTVSSDDYPEMLQEWPWPIAVTHTTRLRAGALQIDLHVTNLGGSAMPLGVGLHPYFRAPIGGQGDRDRCLVQVEATHWWEQEQAFPTGRVEEPSGALDLRSARALGELPAHETPRGKSVNELYTRFGRPATSPLADTGVRAALVDPALGVAVHMSTSDSFRALVLFTPPWTQSVSLEPHTCVPDAFNVAATGLDSGVIALGAGETWGGWARFTAETVGRR